MEDPMPTSSFLSPSNPSDLPSYQRGGGLAVSVPDCATRWPTTPHASASPNSASAASAVLEQMGSMAPVGSSRRGGASEGSPAELDLPVESGAEMCRLSPVPGYNFVGSIRAPINKFEEGNKSRITTGVVATNKKIDQISERC
ncbi:uncharacterized protein [Lolium perenne]|uniref:uncharacterized protein isoform X3 n=1 Tax=Lolium perenne TaxID=4522 RepID=UPI003A99BA3F